jgi:hypothetical protein
MTELYNNTFNNYTLNNTLNNTIDDTGESYDDLKDFVSVSVFILFSFIFVAGLIGNGLVVMGELKSRKKTHQMWHNSN